MSHIEVLVAVLGIASVGAGLAYLVTREPALPTRKRIDSQLDFIREGEDHAVEFMRVHPDCAYELLYLLNDGPLDLESEEILNSGNRVLGYYDGVIILTDATIKPNRVRFDTDDYSGLGAQTAQIYPVLHYWA